MILYQCAVSHTGLKVAQPYLGLGTGSPWLSLGGPFLSSFAQMGLESSVYWQVLFVVFQISLPVWLYFSRHSHLQYYYCQLMLSLSIIFASATWPQMIKKHFIRAWNPWIMEGVRDLAYSWTTVKRKKTVSSPSISGVGVQEKVAYWIH